MPIPATRASAGSRAINGPIYGMNSISPAIRASVKIPSIFIPKSRGYDDQYGRAKRAFDAHATLFLEENQIQSHLINNLKTLFDRKTEMVQNASSFLKTDGAEQAARFLVEKIKS